MSVINMIKVIKELHNNDVVLVKIGTFYNAYLKDAYVLAYVCGYNLRTIEGSNPISSFPVNSLPKIENILSSKKINYLIIDRLSNYEVIEHEDYKKLNTYEDTYNEAHYYYSIKRRIDGIYSYLNNSLNKSSIKPLLNSIEELIDKERNI